LSQHVIHLHRNAPAKPAEGQPCNGCGVCCALETCPAARLIFLKIKGPCPALEWSESAEGHGYYRCGLLLTPKRYLQFLPLVASAWVSRLFARWIAAGKGCDCNVETVSGTPVA
jgi:hypothetical protein